MKEDVALFLEEVRSKTDPIQVDLAKHVPTDNELNNIAYLSMKYGIGWQMRNVDFMAVKLMSTGQGLAGFQEALADYNWDHIMGEPDDITVEDILECVKAITLQVYGMPVSIRDAI